MKNLFFIALLFPLFAAAQKPTVISVTRFFPKNDKIAEFEKVLKNHATKYHTGTWSWRVYTIESGPDAGGYHIVEGPATWDQVDKRNNLGAEHMNDLYKNLLPTVEKTTQSFVTYREDLSSVQLTDYTDKIAITHVFPKPGRFFDTENNIMLAKKVWDASKQDIAVYESSSSGPGQFIIVTRYKDGLKERELNYRKPMKERFNETNGEGSFDKWQASIAETTDSQWSEMLFLDANLSAK